VAVRHRLAVAGEDGRAGGRAGFTRGMSLSTSWCRHAKALGSSLKKRTTNGAETESTP
jgi:hypothetical protein